MTRIKILLLTLPFSAACLIPEIAVASSVYQCMQSGRRVGWADVPTQCPSGSTAEAFTPVSICVIPGACLDIEPPATAVPIEFLCCEYVCGELSCTYAAAAFECGPDQYLATCNWGQTESDGTVTCFD